MLDKDLEKEFLSLKTEFVGAMSKIDDLISKYSSLERKYEKNMKRSKNVNFKCHNCGEKFESVGDLKKHKADGCQGDFVCEECDKKFQNESKLEMHKLTHKKFECDECDRIFKHQAILEKHIQAAHEDITLYCHYFNNDKDCPYENECIFVHEESEICKFSSGCERLLCMYRHEGDNAAEDDTDDESDDGDADDDSMDVDVAEIKPVLEKLEEAFEKLSVNLKKHFGPLKCEMCEFEAKNENGLTMHKRAKHTSK